MLADGTRVDVDAVVAATGFRTGLEPLVGHLGVLDDRDEPVMHGGRRTSASPRPPLRRLPAHARRRLPRHRLRGEGARADRLTPLAVDRVWRSVSPRAHRPRRCLRDSLVPCTIAQAPPEPDRRRSDRGRSGDPARPRRDRRTGVCSAAAGESHQRRPDPEHRSGQDRHQGVLRRHGDQHRRSRHDRRRHGQAPHILSDRRLRQRDGGHRDRRDQGPRQGRQERPSSRRPRRSSSTSTTRR